MNNLQPIITKLKETITKQRKSKTKILDKDIAIELGIKPALLASYKRRDKSPFKIILSYCHNNRLDVVKILFSESEPIINYPAQVPMETNKVKVKYFKTLEAYANYLKKYPMSSSKILEIL